MATRLKWFGMLRTYSFNAVDARSFEPLPAEVETWVDSRVRGIMRFKHLSPVDISFKGSPFECHRAVLVNISSGYADVLLYSNSPGLPVALLLNSWNLINHSESFERRGRQVSLQELWDDVVDEVLGTGAATLLERSAFGSISLVGRDPEPELGYVEAENDVEADIDEELNLSDSLKLSGVNLGEVVCIERNSLTVLHEQPDDVVTEAPWGYVLLAGLFARSRLIADQIMRRATEVSSEINRTDRRRLAEDVLTQAAKVQQFGIQSRSWIQGASYLGNPHLVAIFNRAEGLASLGEVEHQNQSAALEGLDRFANGLSSAFTARSQRRLNSVGFVVAILSLLLSGINVTYLEQAKPEPRLWVFGTWLITLGFLSGALAFSVWFASEWRKARR